jgi:AcrR family transcriptional regulator
LTKRKRTRRARGSLSPEEILAGARRLVEQHGLEQLSMPGLARELGSGVTSIYWYFRSKEDLLVALASQVTEELYSRLPPVSDKRWDEEFEAYFVAFRAEAQREYVYLELFTRYPRFLFPHTDLSRTILPRLEQELAVLVRAGLSAEQAAQVYGVCSAYTRGFVLLEHGLVGEEPADGTPEQVDDLVAALDPTQFPTLTQLPSFDRSMWLDDSHFRFGLRLLIEGIRSRFQVLSDPRA